MNDGNWKMRCLDNGGSSFCKTGNVYEAKDGKFQKEGGVNSTKYKSFEDFIMHNTNTPWELIKEESKFTLDDIKEGYLVRIRDGRLLLVVRMEDGGFIGYDKKLNYIVDINKSYYDAEMNSRYSIYNGEKYEIVPNTEEYDITEAYGNISDEYDKALFSTSNRTLLYKREELSPQQLKLKELEDKQREIADEISKLRESL